MKLNKISPHFYAIVATLIAIVWMYICVVISPFFLFVLPLGLVYYAVYTWFKSITL